MTRPEIATAPVAYLRDAVARSDWAGVALAAKWLAAGTLVGSDSPTLRRAFEAARAVSPTRAFTPPEPAVGTIVVADSDGTLHRALRIRLMRHVPLAAAPTPWMDDNAHRAFREAERCVRDMVTGTPPVSFDTLGPADGDPDWRVPCSQRPVRGDSVGLPLALARLSDWLDQPLPVDIAATGRLQGSNVLPVSRIDEKAQAIVTERPYVRRFFVPQASSYDDSRFPTLRFIPVASVDQAAREAGLDPSRPMRCPDSTGAMLHFAKQMYAFAEDRRFNVPDLRRAIEGLVCAIERVPPSSRGAAHAQAHLLALTRLVEVCTNDLATEDALAAAEQLERLRNATPSLLSSDPAVVVRGLILHASALIDVPRLDDAECVVKAALLLGAQIPLERLRAEETRGRILAHALRDEEAVACLRAVLDAQIREMPENSNIARCYLARSLLRLGRVDEAEQQIAEGRAFNEAHPEMPDGWREDNALFLDYEHIRVLIHRRKWGEADECARKLARHAESRGGVWPLLGILNRRVDALIGMRRIDLARDVVARMDDLANASRSRNVRWTTALAHAAILACDIEDGAAGTDADWRALQTACLEIPEGAQGPFVAGARSVVKHRNATASELLTLRSNDIY